MTRVLATLRRRRDHEAGATLIELLVVMMLLAMVSSIVATTVIFTSRQSGRTQARQQNTDQGRVALDAMTKSMRTAIQPAQLQSTCTTCSTTYSGVTAVTAASDTFIRFYANVDFSVGGPSIVSFTVAYDTPRKVATLVQTIQAPDVGSAPNYTYCTPGPSTCRVTTRELVHGVTWPLAAPVFRYYTSAGAVLAPGSGGLTSTQLSSVDSVDITLPVKVANPYGQGATTITDRVTLPNADTSVLPSPTP